MHGVLIRISSSTEPISSNFNKYNTLAFWPKNLRLPKPHSPVHRRGPLVSNVLHSRTLARLSYNMCFTLEFCLNYHIECASFSHSGLIIVANVPHSRILARLLYQMCSTLAFWLDGKENLRIPIKLKIPSAFSPDLQPPSIWPTSSPHLAGAGIQPASSQHPASIKPAFSQHQASI
jgi:hypothetical protein